MVSSSMPQQRQQHRPVDNTNATSTMTRQSPSATRVSPEKSYSSPHDASLQQTTFSTFESSLSPVPVPHEDHVDAEERALIRRHREIPAKSIVDRFEGLPEDRLGIIARALSNAGNSYIEEASHNHGSAQFFENTIDRALLPLLDPNIASRSVGRSFSLVDLEEADLVPLIRNMKKVMASQREEIHCLRMTVQELVVEIADGDDLPEISNGVPNVIQVEESSSEASVDKGIFRSRDQGQQAHKSAPKDTTDDYSYLISSIARSRNSSDSISHMEPEGRYASEEMNPEYREVKRKKDPPSSVSDTKALHRSVSKGTGEAEIVPDETLNLNIDRASQGDLLHEFSDDRGRSEDWEQARNSEGEEEAIAAAALATIKRLSPSRNQAKQIVQERRRRYQNFRRSREVDQQRRQREAISRANEESARSRANTTGDNYGDKDIDSMPSRSSGGMGYQASPLIHFREDELTLMETKATKIEPGVDK